MKPIRITAKNSTAITAALLAANGRAEAHCYQYAHEVQAVANAAEKRLEALLLPKKQWVGASFTITSGAPVSNAYGKKSSTRKATRITIECRATGWFLTDVASVDVYQKGGGPGRIALTSEQSLLACRAFTSQYWIKP